MIDYREILRLQDLGDSKRSIVLTPIQKGRRTGIHGETGPPMAGHANRHRWDTVDELGL